MIFLAENYQTLRDGELSQSRRAVDIQLGHDVLAVRFNGANTDPKSAGDFLIAKAFGDVNQNFALPLREFSSGWSLTGAGNKLT